MTAAALTVVLLGARAISARRARAAAAPIEVRAEERVAAVVRPPRLQPAVATPAPRPAPAGVVHLRGRVILPRGTQAGRDKLEVNADDGRRVYDAAVTPEGRFDLHLPANEYTLTGSLGDLVALRAGVVARPGATEELTLTLEPAVSIEGSIVPASKGGGNPGIEITRAGTELDDGEVGIGMDGHFEIGGLARGVAYDVTVSDRGRRVVLRGLVAPTRVEVSLSRLVTLRGQIGFEPGTRCPFKEVVIEEEDDDHHPERVDRNCRFQFEEVTSGLLTLLATGPGWHAEGQVSIPSEGQPDIVCLNPPCRNLPPVQPASLRVVLTDPPQDSNMVAHVRQEERSTVCDDRGSCLIEDLIPDVKSELSVSARGCADLAREITLVSGPNVISVPCRHTRVVEGFARGGVGETATLSCQNGEDVDLGESAFFRIECPAEATELHFRSGTGPWRTAALRPGVGRAFVELTL